MRDRLRIVAGSHHDYDDLARFHYRGGPPATIERVLVAWDRKQRAGVLVISRPVLNAAWRELGWPGLFRTGDRREDARRVNALLRTISRVVVEPRYRGLSIARRLVRSYLRAPQTPHTEAVAAMGAISPFFARAGMRELVVPTSSRDRVLARDLRALRVRPEWLADVAWTTRELARSPDLHAALARWARGHKGVRGVRGTRGRGELVDVAVLAAGGLVLRPRAYVWP